MKTHSLHNGIAHGTNMELYWQMMSYVFVRGFNAFDFGRSSRESATYRIKKK